MSGSPTATASPRIRAGRSGRSAGFTYIGILFVVAFLGMGLAAIGQLWSFGARRADEDQLLWVGHGYRQAIGSYYRARGQFPQSLDDLVADKASSPPARYLRKLYADPITRSAEWRLITGAEGGIVGVASPSMAKPIKVAKFDVDDKLFEDAQCYCDWEFVYTPPAQRFRLRSGNNSAVPLKR